MIIKDTLLNYEKNYGAPISTIIMNSTLWDVNRWNKEFERGGGWSLYTYTKLFFYTNSPPTHPFLQLLLVVVQLN